MQKHSNYQLLIVFINENMFWILGFLYGCGLHNLLPYIFGIPLELLRYKFRKPSRTQFFWEIVRYKQVTHNVTFYHKHITN